MSELLDDALKGIKAPIRKKLITSYLDLKRNIAEARHDSAGMSAGKLCESAIRHLQQEAFDQHTPFGTKIVNFADECRRIITSPATSNITDSEKQILPRSLVFLYTMRNKRGIGHVGGDVDPNSIDTAVIGCIADWIICELIRVHHSLSLEEAQDLIDGLAVRQLPDIWDVAGKKRVLRDGLTAREEALLLLYSSKDQVVFVEDLLSWIEYSNPASFKSNILSKLHNERLLEWDRESQTIVLSPKGAIHVENEILRP